jgi:hypothetical protein
LIDRIIDLFFSVALAVPLVISIPYLVKFIIDSKKKNSTGKFLIKLIIFVILTCIALFLIFIIAVTFVFVDIETPKAVSILGLVLFPLYYFTFGGFLYGLGTLGHAGVSPATIFKELYKDLKNIKVRNKN